MKQKTKASKLLSELSPEEVMDLYTFISEFHHYCANDIKLLPSVRCDFMKRSFMLRYKLEAYIDDMEV